MYQIKDFKSEKISIVSYSLLIVFLLFASHGTIYAQIDPELDDALQEILDNARESFDAVGATMAVTLPEHGTWVGASGLSDQDAGIAMVPENLFVIASTTKNFTSAIALKLAQEGVLTLEDSVEQWLPGLVPNGENITIRHMLDHTSGLFNYTTPEFLTEVLENLEKEWQPEELVALATAQPPYFAPGEGWAYSSTGYILVGMIIETATSSTVAQEIRDHLLEPLQLNNTFMYDPEAIPDGLCHGYGPIGAPTPYTSMATCAWTAGSMVSNAEDLAKWVEALCTGQVLDESSLEEMFTFVELSPTVGYGLGVYRYEWPVGLALGHGGWIPGYTTSMYYMPHEGVTIVTLVNEDYKNILGAVVPEIFTLEIFTLEATVDFDPDALNLDSKGEWIACYIELPEIYDVGDIDVATVTLEDTIPAEISPTAIGDSDGDGIPDLMVKFDRQALTEYLSGATGDVTLTVTGALNFGRPLEGNDTIRVIIPGEAAPAAPLAFEAPEPYPRPANPEVWIPYTLGKSVEVSITIYNTSGQLIRALSLGYQPTGAYISRDKAAYWDGKNESGEQVASGIYFYTIQAGEFTATKKMTIAK